MNENFHYGTGRRKTATARTRLYSGSGAIRLCVMASAVLCFFLIRLSAEF